MDEALIMERIAHDSGARIDLDQALVEFGFSREELASEMKTDN